MVHIESDDICPSQGAAAHDVEMESHLDTQCACPGGSASRGSPYRDRSRVPPNHLRGGCCVGGGAIVLSLALLGASLTIPKPSIP